MVVETVVWKEKQPKTEAEIALEKAQDLHPPRTHQEVEEKPEEKSEVKKDKSCLNLTAKAVPKPPVRAKEEEPSESEPKESEAASGSRPEGGEGHRRRHRRHRERKVQGKTEVRTRGVGPGRCREGDAHPGRQEVLRGILAGRLEIPVL